MKKFNIVLLITFISLACFQILQADIPLKHADKSLTKDKAFVLEAVKQNGSALKYADDSLKKDKEVVLEAVKERSLALKYADDSLKKDKAFVLEAVKQRGSALKYADDSLKKDKEVVLEAVKQNGSALKYADDSLKKDKEVVLEAVKQDDTAFHFSDNSLKKDKDITEATDTKVTISALVNVASGEVVPIMVKISPPLKTGDKLSLLSNNHLVATVTSDGGFTYSVFKTRVKMVNSGEVSVRIERLNGQKYSHHLYINVEKVAKDIERHINAKNIKTRVKGKTIKVLIEGYSNRILIKTKSGTVLIKPTKYISKDIFFLFTGDNNYSDLLVKY